MRQCGHAHHWQRLTLRIALRGHRCNVSGSRRTAAIGAAAVNPAHPCGLHLIVKVLLNRVLQLIEIALSGTGTL